MTVRFGIVIKQDVLWSVYRLHEPKTSSELYDHGPLFSFFRPNQGTLRWHTAKDIRRHSQLYSKAGRHRGRADRDDRYSRYTFYVVSKSS